MVIDLDNERFKKQDARILELFAPVHDQLLNEGIDAIGIIYSVVMDLVLRDATMSVPQKKFDAVFNEHYDRTVDAIAKMIDDAYDLKAKIAKRKAEAEAKAAKAKARKPKAKRKAKTRVINLMDALQESIGKPE